MNGSKLYDRIGRGIKWIGEVICIRVLRLKEIYFSWILRGYWWCLVEGVGEKYLLGLMKWRVMNEICVGCRIVRKFKGKRLG